MTIVQRIVTLNHGQIAIKSEPGQGMLVSITLPKELKKNSVSFNRYAKGCAGRSCRSRTAKTTINHKVVMVKAPSVSLG